MISKYENFKIESLLESLLLESKLQFSDRLFTLINSLPSGKVKEILIDLQKSGKDLTISQNYFDLSDSKEEITFIQDRRAQSILGDQPMKFKTTSSASSAYLTFNKKSDGTYTNQIIFNDLEFDPETSSKNIPNSGVVGEVVRETPSRKTPGKIYVLFKWINESEEDFVVLNKTAVIPYDDRIDRIWQLTKNPIRIGRAIRSIINSSGISVTDADIEKFVNDYKSSWDIMNDAFSKFDIVNSDKIAYWYHIDNYEDGGRSTLGNSCMSDVDSDFFDIYVENSSVCSLVILYGENGILIDGKFKGSKIKGRALLWKTDSGDMFMDRIYYNNESDVQLFKRFAEKNGWWYKNSQDSDVNFSASNGSSTKYPNYVVSLNYASFNNYPYVDTLCFLSKSSKKMSNSSSGMYYEMRSTSGFLEGLDG